MVVFVDLEEESEPPERAQHWSLHGLHANHVGFGIGGLTLKEGVQRDNPNKNAITEALGCYPYFLPLTNALYKWTDLKLV
jgi:hypothetical protein